MKRGRTGGRKILAIIIGGIISAIILAVIAVPLYTGYVESARVTRATSIMMAIITSQKVEKQRTGNFYTASAIAEFNAKGVDISDNKYFTYKTVTTPDGGFTVTATPTDAFGTYRGPTTYTYEPSRGGRWGNDEDIMPYDMYEPHPPSHSPPYLWIHFRTFQIPRYPRYEA